VTVAEIAFGAQKIRPDGTAARQGRGMSAPDGMIAAISRVNGGRLATRNLGDFGTTGLKLFSPWEF
jgi:predicted nucleic acid-binding protein